jgi:5'-methylthioadenosine phosphorylase
MRIGIIGGTGVHDLADLQVRPEAVHTPYGVVPTQRGSLGGHDLVFIARHGAKHDVPPHLVNYRGHIDALRRRECECILATNAVGSLRPDMLPGEMVLPDQFLDFTHARAGTFYEGGSAGVRHVDVTEPYCPAMREAMLGVLEEHGETAHPAATYVCTEGPRFETPAEIRMFERLGGDLVGMTGVPEAVLAREAGLCYLSVCVVTNFAAGMAGAPLREGEVGALMRERLPSLRTALLAAAQRLYERRPCGCRG